MACLPKYVSILLVFSFGFIATERLAQANPNPSKTVAPANSPPASDETQQKRALAIEIMNILEVADAFQTVLKGGELQIKNTHGPTPQTPEAKAKLQKAQEIALTKYQSLKPKILQDLNSRMQNDLLQKFTLAELKYLLEVYKVPATRKLHKYFDSTDFYTITQEAMVEAKDCLQQAKKELGLPADAKSTK